MMEVSPKSRFSDDEVTNLGKCLADLTRAKIPLTRGLATMAAEFPPGRFQQLLQEMSDGLEAGESLENVLTRYNDRLPPYFRGLIIAGVRSGRLDEVLGSFLDQRRNRRDARRQTMLSLFYPTLVFVVVAFLLMFILLYVVPGFRHIFDDFGVELPTMTLWTLELSDLLEIAWPWLAGALLAAVLAVGVLTSVDSRFVARLPLAGSLWRYTALAEFFSFLSMMLRCGLPLPVALRLVGTAMVDPRLERIGDQLADRAEKGARFSDAVAMPPSLADGLQPMVRWGEDNNALPEAASVIADIFECRAKSRLNAVWALAPAVLVCGTGLLVGFIVISLLLPLIKLLNDLGSG